VVRQRSGDFRRNATRAGEQGMWGNRLGWTISALIVCVAGGLVWLLAGNTHRSPATAFSRDSRNFERLTLPALPSLRSSATAASTATDANSKYRGAIAFFAQDRALYEDFAASGTLKFQRVGALAAIDLLVGATDGAASADIFASHPGEVVNYDHTKDSIEALRTLGRVLIDRLALLNLKAGNRDLAEKSARAGAALGDALCRERLCYPEFELGQELLGKSATLLARIADERHDANTAAAWRTFEEQRRAFVTQRIEPVVTFVRSIDAKVVGTRSGDVFELAARSKEPMWRVEAVLALGRLRYFVGTSRSAADQRAALAVVKTLAETDPDPAVRTAAAAARDLTVEQYRMQ
jgi:hypothetical protein